MRFVEEKNIVSVNGKQIITDENSWPKKTADELRMLDEIRIINQANRTDKRRASIIAEHVDPHPTKFAERDAVNAKKALDKLEAAKKKLEQDERQVKINAARAAERERLQAAAARGRAK